MADFTKTMTNSLNLFGGAPSNKWASYNWNAFIWGEGTADFAVSFLKILDSGAITPSDAYIINVDFSKSLTNSLSVDADMGSETLRDSAGYLYVYPNNVTEAESRSFASYTSGSDASNSWSSASVSSVTWS